MNRFRIGAVLALLVAAAAFAQTKQPLTHEALWMMKRVGAPLPSPDGKWVVFSLTEPSYDEKESVSDLWIVPADGSAKPRRITSSKASESDVTPYRFAARALAPARTSSFAVSRSSWRAAQCSAVVPSTCAASTSTRPSSRARTAALSIFFAASASRASEAAPNRPTTDNRHVAIVITEVSGRAVP